MSTILEDPLFVFMWLGFLVLMSVGIAAFFLWAIREGQFSQQDRARYLALESCMPLGAQPGKGHTERPKEPGGRL